MATDLTDRAYNLSQQIDPRIQMVLEIDGIDEIFGAIAVTKTARIGDVGLIIDDPPVFYIGGVIDHEFSRDWIDLGGSTKSLSQQLSNDSTGLASFQTMKVRIIDKDQRLSRIFSRGFQVDDILARQANVYIGFEGGAHPEDSVKIISGLVDAIDFASGNAVVSVTHPENLKRQRIFPVIERVTTADIHYNSITVQDVLLKRRNQLRDLLSIEYLDTVAAGSETASISGTKITVNIQSGVSTATQVEDAISSNTNINAVLETDITGNEANTQTAFAETPFLKTDTIDLDNASEHILPVDILRTYIQIEDELMEFTGRTANTLTGVTRGQLNTIPDFHEADEEASTFYRLVEADPITLALKLLLSNGGLDYKTGVDAVNFNQADPDNFIQNSIFFNDSDIEFTLGLVSGDKITIASAINGANNFTDRLIVSFGILSTGSYVVVDGANLVTETESPATTSFKSKYNVLPKNIGLQLNPLFVDVDRHQSILATFLSNFRVNDIYIKDDREGSGFINKDIFLPFNLFSIPRAGKISLNIIKPPLSSADSKFINKDNIKRPENIVLRRSINSKFYNAITYRYEQDSLEDKFLGGIIIDSASSQTDIPIGIRDLVIDAPAIRKDPNTDALLLNNGTKQILRYRYGAENMGVEVLFRDGFNVDIGDTFIFDGADLFITDTNSGNRNFAPRIMEVGNKEMNIETGEIKFELIDTAFNIDGRFGVVGPASKLASGSTTSIIRLKKSFATTDLEVEVDKWKGFENESVRIRNGSLSFDETVTFISVHGSIPNAIIVSPPLSSAPPEDYFLDMPAYDPTNTIADALWKTVHCFSTPQVSITAGVSSTRFTVGAGDIAKFTIGNSIRIHNDDFSSDSDDNKVDSIIGNDIITKDDMGFTPTSAFNVELIGFGDEGKPYRIL